MKTDTAPRKLSKERACRIASQNVTQPHRIGFQQWVYLRKQGDNWVESTPRPRLGAIAARRNAMIEMAKELLGLPTGSGFYPETGRWQQHV